MVLNLLRVEEINPEYMLEKSFYQFQHYRAIPGVVESKYKLIIAEPGLTSRLSRPLQHWLMPWSLLFSVQPYFSPYIKEYRTVIW